MILNSNGDRLIGNGLYCEQETRITLSISTARYETVLPQIPANTESADVQTDPYLHIIMQQYTRTC